MNVLYLELTPIKTYEIYLKPVKNPKAKPQVLLFLEVYLEPFIWEIFLITEFRNLTVFFSAIWKGKLLDSYLYAKSQNDLASNSGDIADPRILQSEWLKAIPNHTHPKKDSYSFTFLYVIFHEKKQNKYADKKLI